LRCPGSTRQAGLYAGDSSLYQGGVGDLGCAGVSNWNRLYPDNNVALETFAGLCAMGKSWDDGRAEYSLERRRRGIFDENWFGVLFGAAAGWQPGESSEDAFTDSYGWCFTMTRRARSARRSGS